MRKNGIVDVQEDAAIDALGAIYVVYFVVDAIDRIIVVIGILEGMSIQLVIT